MYGTIKKVEAGGRAIPTIDIEIEITNDDQKNIYMVGYSIDLSLCNVPIGSIQKFRTTNLEPRRPEQIRENFPIYPFIFQSIERERKGGDVPVSLNVGVFHIESTGQIGSGSFRFYGINMPHPFKLSERDWITMISKLGYSNYALFEIQYPKQPSIQNLNDAIKRLEEAQQLLKEVVTKCRKSFEILNPLVTIQTASGTTITPQLSSQIDIGCGGKQGEPPKSERIEHIRQKIWKLLHIGPHEGYSVSREDAEYVYWLCLSTIRYYAIQFNKLSSTE